MAFQNFHKHDQTQDTPRVNIHCAAGILLLLLASWSSLVYVMWLFSISLTGREQFCWVMQPLSKQMTENDREKTDQQWRRAIAFPFQIKSFKTFSWFKRPSPNPLSVWVVRMGGVRREWWMERGRRQFKLKEWKTLEERPKHVPNRVRFSSKVASPSTLLRSVCVCAYVCMLVCVCVVCACVWGVHVRVCVLLIEDFEIGRASCRERV